MAEEAEQRRESSPERVPQGGEIPLAQRVKIEALKQGVRMAEFSPDECRRIHVLRGSNRPPSWDYILTDGRDAFSTMGNLSNAGNVDDLFEKLELFTQNNPRLPKGSDSELTFRAVAAPYSSTLTADEIVRSALENGGGNPHDTGVGSWFSNDYKVQEYFQGAFTVDEAVGPSDYVLFIYDIDRLEDLSEAEFAEAEVGNGDLARTYKLKPKSGSELKDCLVGVMIFRGERVA